MPIPGRRPGCAPLRAPCSPSTRARSRSSTTPWRRRAIPATRPWRASRAVRHQRLYDRIAERFLRPGPQPPPPRRRPAPGLPPALRPRPPSCRTPPATVAALRAAGHPRLVGIANAVLRRCAELRLAERDGEGPLGRLAADQRPRALAVRHSLPTSWSSTCARSCRAARRTSPPSTASAPLCTRSLPGLAPPSGAACCAGMAPGPGGAIPPRPSPRWWRPGAAGCRIPARARRWRRRARAPAS